MIKYVNHDVVFQEFPDEVTLAINLSLCPHRCIGCHSAYLQTDVGDELSPLRLQTLLSDYEQHITCVGFMGGDNDIERLAQLALWVRQHYAGRIKVGWYSGNTAPPTHIPLYTFDYIKIGPYTPSRGPLSASTTNQRLYRISPTGDMIDITKRCQKG